MTSAGSRDIFILKLNSSGDFVWAKNFGGAAYENLSSFALDVSGNIYLTGSFDGTTNLNPGAGVFPFTSFGNADVFVTYLDSSGNFRAGAHFGGTDFDNPNSITVDASGTVTIVGQFFNVIDANPCEGVLNLISAGSADAFILALNQPISISLGISTPSTTITAGQSVVVTSVASNGGSAPVYQWQDSTSAHNWQNISGAVGSSLNYSPSQTGDKLRCIMTSNAICASNTSVISNVIVFTVNTITVIPPVQGSAFNIRHFPNPAQKTLHIDSLKISDKWQALTIINQGGEIFFMTEAIANKTNFMIDIQKLPAGLYIVILQRKQGSAAYLKFIKQ